LLAIEIFISECLLEDNGFHQSFHHAISQQRCSIVRRELMSIIDISSIIGDAKITETSSSSGHLEMKGLSDISECAQAASPFYQAQEQIELVHCGTLFESESSQSRGLWQ
jgi:hypothetical protein